MGLLHVRLGISMSGLYVCREGGGVREGEGMSGERGVNLV